MRTYSTEETIQKLFLGLPCLLDNYRSLEQKLDLLQRAVETADGNIILKVGFLFAIRVNPYCKSFPGRPIFREDIETVTVTFIFTKT